MRAAQNQSMQPALTRFIDQQLLTVVSPAHVTVPVQRIIATESTARMLQKLVRPW
jgi:hypothetical protein